MSTDIFEQKKKVIDGFVKILTNENTEIFPLCIDGDWGIGKTYFVGKLIDELTKSSSFNREIISIDSYKDDYYTNPLQSLCEEILKKKSLRSHALEASKNICKNLLKIASKSIKIPYTDISAEDISKINTDIDIENLLKNSNKQLLQSIRKNLSTLVKGQPIIIFIDELDRCRPSYALQMLEVIKHIFYDIDNIKIVIVANKRVLAKQIEHTYGVSDDEAMKYLDKFIKFTYPLPLNFKEQDRADTSTSFDYFVDLFSKKISSSIKIREGNISWAGGQEIEYMLTNKEHSLRDVQKIINYFVIYNINSNNLSQENFLEVFIVIYFLIYQEDVFYMILHGNPINTESLDKIPHFSTTQELIDQQKVGKNKYSLLVNDIIEGSNKFIKGRCNMNDTIFVRMYTIAKKIAIQ